MNYSSLLVLKEQIESQRKDIAQRQDKVKELQRFLEANCPHLTKKTTSKYYDSGYDYPAETHYFHECTVCGNVTKQVEVHPRWF
ncbi:hypothetical protein [Ralstonia phage RSP15]|uniref:hypothetical protein n=1 Tax=Ralstonia phage RSP15 TaxID=1785960 RepID=UPI00074D4CB4|nr:hypothetical protein BH754_gp182 [Ralstonia phage RSP15]BAU40124.1 hypothetical protein [Ralstonia phage RSP15]